MSTRPRPTAKIIGFITDLPDDATAATVALAADEASPLTGVIAAYAPLTAGSWVTRPLTQAQEEALRAHFDGLGAAAQPRLRSGFLQVQLAGDPLWADPAAEDRAAHVWSLIGEAVTRGQLAGAFVDPLPYGARTWSPAAGMTFDEARAGAQRRGLTMGRALFARAPSATLALAVGASDHWRAVCVEGMRPQDTGYALWPAFVAGLRAARAEVGAPALVDAFLPSYLTKQPHAFAMLRHLLRGDAQALREAWKPGVETFSNVPRLEDSRLVAWPPEPAWGCAADTVAPVAADEIQVAFSLWLDAPTQLGGMSSLDTTGSAYFAPDQLAAAMHAAAAASDGYLFIWTSSTSWRSGDELPPVPQSYRRVVAGAAQLERFVARR